MQSGHDVQCIAVKPFLILSLIYLPSPIADELGRGTVLKTSGMNQ